MVEVTFLGVGAAVPAPGQTNCAYLVRSGDLVLLIDCGPAILQQLEAARVDPGDVTHLFVSHRHGDHCLGYPMFLLARFIEKCDAAGLVVLASDQTIETVESMASAVYGDLIDRVGRTHLGFAQERAESFSLGKGVTLTTYPMRHSTFAPVSGLRLELAGRTIAFTADTEPCPEVLELAADADLLVHDAQFCATLDPSKKGGAIGHSTALDAADNATKARARRLALVHRDPQLVGQDHVFAREAAQRFNGEVLVPADGDRLVL